MIRVMIVEDEPPILRMLGRMVEDYGGPFKVVETALNGKNALDKLMNTPVDILFTDVRMPVMDGLALAEQVRLRWPETSVVVISGYQDFEYARKALQYHVFDYLLKPVSREAMSELLKKLEVEVATKSSARLRRRMESSLHGGAVQGNGFHEEPGESEEKYGVMLLCAGPFPLVPDDSLLPAGSFWGRFNLEEKVQSLLGGSNDFMCFNGRSLAEKILVLTLDSDEALRGAAGKLHRLTREDGSLPVSLAVHGELCSLADTGSVFNTLRSLMYSRIVLFHSSLFISGEANNSPASEAVLEDAREKIEKSLALGEAAGVKKVFIEVFEVFGKSGIPQMEIVQFLESLSPFKPGLKPSDRKLAYLKLDLAGAVSNCIHPPELAEDIALLICPLPGEESSHTSQSNALLSRVETYLDENYSKDITTTLLSKKFGLVPSYLSKLFRNYKGMSPSDYLTYLRMKKARELMRQNPSMLVKELASYVGYSDPYYFSKIFKKETGLWPSEYIVQISRE